MDFLFLDASGDSEKKMNMAGAQMKVFDVI